MHGTRKQMVWGDVLGQRYIELFIINGNLNVDTYLDMLHDRIMHTVLNAGLFPEWFQQKWRIPHYEIENVRQWLVVQLPNV